MTDKKDQISGARPKTQIQGTKAELIGKLEANEKALAKAQLALERVTRERDIERTDFYTKPGVAEEFQRAKLHTRGDNKPFLDAAIFWAKIMEHDRHKDPKHPLPVEAVIQPALEEAMLAKLPHSMNPTYAKARMSMRLHEYWKEGDAVKKWFADRPKGGVANHDLQCPHSDTAEQRRIFNLHERSNRSGGDLGI